jgi:hypothetical protein
VLLGSIPYEIIGTAKHRLWLQLYNVSMVNPISKAHPQSATSSHGSPMPKTEYEKSSRNISENTKEFVGLTRGTLDHLFSLNSVQFVKSKHGILSMDKSRKSFGGLSLTNPEGEMIRSIGRKNEITPNITVPSPPKSDGRESTKSKLSSSSPCGEGGKPWGLCNSVEVVDRFLQQHQDGSWTQIQDEILVLWLESLARSAGVSPQNIDLQLLSSSRSVIAALNAAARRQENVQNVQNARSAHNTYADHSITSVFSAHTDEDIRVRVVMLLHLNDLLSPLLPLVVSIDGTEVPIGGRNHPTQRLKNLRHLIFLPVISEFTRKICSTVTSTCAPDPEGEKDIGVHKINLQGQGRSPSPAFSPSPSHAPTPLDAAAFSSYSSFSTPGGGNIIQQMSPGVRVPVPFLQVSSSSILNSLAQSTEGSPSKPKVLPVPKANYTVMMDKIEGDDMTGAGVGSIPNYGTDVLMLEVEEEASLADQILNYSDEKRKLNSFYDSNGSERKDFLLRKYTDLEDIDTDSGLDVLCDNRITDIRWNLRAGIQCSLLGQMMKYFGVISEGLGVISLGGVSKIGNSNEPKNDFTIENGWENKIRSVCSKNILWVENLKTRTEDQKVPFHIRTKKSTKNTSNLSPSRLFQILAIAESHSGDFFIKEKCVKIKNGISQRNIFTVFVIQALEQVFRIYPFSYLFLLTPSTIA